MTRVPPTRSSKTVAKANIAKIIKPKMRQHHRVITRSQTSTSSNKPTVRKNNKNAAKMKKITGEMKAEDHFRLRIDKNTKCLWDNKGISFKKNITAKHSHFWKKAYDAHINKLQTAFGDNSPFKVQLTVYGLGIFMKKTLTQAQLQEACERHITAVIQGIQRSCNNWSGVKVFKKVTQRGNIKNGTIRPYINMQVNCNLVGTLDFVNHACYRHSQITFTVIKLKVTVKAIKGIQKNEELYLDYGSEYDGVKCSQCALSHKK